MSNRNPLIDPRPGDVVSCYGGELVLTVQPTLSVRATDASGWEHGFTIENWRQWCEGVKAAVVQKGGK